MKKIVQKKTLSRKPVAKTAHAPKEGVPPPHSVLSAIAAGGEYEEAFNKTASERAALDPAALAPRNIDVLAAANTALVAYPHMVTYRADLVKDPRFDVAQFDAIQTYANATLYAQSQSAGGQESGDLNDVYEEGRTRREIMLNDLRGLVLRKLLPSDTLDGVNTAVGYQNVADGLMKVCTIAQDNLSIVSKSAITIAEINQGRVIAGQIGKLAVSRENVEPTSQIVDARIRSVTLLLNAYDEGRAALAYLRRKEGDVNAIAPSLYSYRASRRKASASEPAAPPVTAAPATPTPPAVAETPAPPPVASSSNGAPTNGAAPTTEALSTNLSGSEANGSAHSPALKAPTL